MKLKDGRTVLLVAIFYLCGSVFTGAYFWNAKSLTENGSKEVRFHNSMVAMDATWAALAWPLYWSVKGALKATEFAKPKYNALETKGN